MTDDDDKKQLKFIEILLIVGGIIGGLGYKSEDSSIRFLLALFLMSSLTYYFVVSTPNELFGGKVFRIIFRNGFADMTSIFFAVLIVNPLMFSTPAIISFWGSGYLKFNMTTNLIGAACFAELIFINLQEKSKIDFGKMLKLLLIFIINIILIWMMFNFLKA